MNLSTNYYQVQMMTFGFPPLSLSEIESIYTANPFVLYLGNLNLSSPGCPKTLYVDQASP